MIVKGGKVMNTYWLYKSHNVMFHENVYTPPGDCGYVTLITSEVLYFPARSKIFIKNKQNTHSQLLSSVKSCHV